MTPFHIIIQTKENNNLLLDEVIKAMKLKNDAQLSRVLELAPPVISKIRHGKLHIGATMALCIHEETGMSFDLIKGILSEGRF